LYFLLLIHSQLGVKDEEIARLTSELEKTKGSGEQASEKAAQDLISMKESHLNASSQSPFLTHKQPSALLGFLNKLPSENEAFGSLKTRNSSFVDFLINEAGNTMALPEDLIGQETEMETLVENLFPETAPQAENGEKDTCAEDSKKDKDFERRSSSLTTLSTVAQLESENTPGAVMKAGFYSQLFKKI